MNIDKMEAGRGIDVLVAYKIMGWTEISTAIGKAWGIPPKQEASVMYDVVMGFGKKAPIPKYSTEIAAAWDITTQIEGAFFLEHPFTVGQFWHARFENRGDGTWQDEVAVRAAGFTAPLAICRAALKLVQCIEERANESENAETSAKGCRSPGKDASSQACNGDGLRGTAYDAGRSSRQRRDAGDGIGLD